MLSLGGCVQNPNPTAGDAGAGDGSGGGGGDGGGRGIGVDAFDNPEIGKVDDAAGFYVRARVTDETPYTTHQNEADFDTKCSTTKGDVYCIVDVPENSLHFNGITLQFNIPTTMCSYLLVSPYYYYRYYPAYTSSIEVYVDSVGNRGLDTNPTDGKGLVETPVSETCAGDYTAAKGPNCCEGNYVLTTHTWNATDKVYDPPKIEMKQWSGKLSNCLSGPAMKTQTFDEDGFPKPTEYFIEEKGKNDVYKVDSPISLSKRTNLYAANFFRPSEHSAFNPQQPPGIVEPFYRFSCLDRAKDTIAEIRVAVREWDTQADLNNRKNDPTKHDRPGEFEDAPFNTRRLNDWLDWRDYYDPDIPDYINNFPGKGE